MMRRNDRGRMAQRSQETGRFYCGGAAICFCGGCDGRCGPTNGCNCSSCQKLDRVQDDREDQHSSSDNRRSFPDLGDLLLPQFGLLGPTLHERLRTSRGDGNGRRRSTPISSSSSSLRSPPPLSCLKLLPSPPYTSRRYDCDGCGMQCSGPVYHAPVPPNGYDLCPSCYKRRRRHLRSSDSSDNRHNGSNTSVDSDSRSSSTSQEHNTPKPPPLCLLAFTESSPYGTGSVINCDGCGISKKGSVYHADVKPNGYDLCQRCFSHRKSKEAEENKEVAEATAASVVRQDSDEITASKLVRFKMNYDLVPSGGIRVRSSPSLTADNELGHIAKGREVVALHGYLRRGITLWRGTNCTSGGRGSGSSELWVLLAPIVGQRFSENRLERLGPGKVQNGAWMLAMSDELGVLLKPADGPPSYNDATGSTGSSKNMAVQPFSPCLNELTLHYSSPYGKGSRWYCSRCGVLRSGAVFHNEDQVDLCLECHAYLAPMISPTTSPSSTGKVKLAKHEMTSGEEAEEETEEETEEEEEEEEKEVKTELNYSTPSSDAAEVATASSDADKAQQPSHSGSDGDCFPWHLLPPRANGGMNKSQLLCAVETEVGMGRANKVIARRLTVGMGRVLEAYVTDYVSVGMGNIDVLHRLPSTVLKVGMGRIRKDVIHTPQELVALMCAHSKVPPPQRHGVPSAQSIDAGAGTNDNPPPKSGKEKTEKTKTTNATAAATTTITAALNEDGTTSDGESVEYEYDIFISLRYAEANIEGAALKAGLEQRGLRVFLCNELPGIDLKRVIVDALCSCRLALILGSKTYGAKGETNFSTEAELDFILEEKIPFFLVKMCDRFKESSTRFVLKSSIAHYPWQPATADEKQNPPTDLFEKIMGRVRELRN
eukprot:UC1_evm1s2170